MAINRSTFNQENNYTPDEFIELYDLSPSQVAQAQRYQQLKLKANKTQEENVELQNLTQSLQNYIISPETWNKFSDALVNMQWFIKNSVEGYINDRKVEFQNEIDKFNFIGEYNPTVTYFKKNVISYQGQSYLCLQDNTLGIIPTDTTKWVLIAKQGSQGEQGQRGADGYNFVFKGTYDPTITYEINDTVQYNGSLYYCKQLSAGNLPTNTTYWELALARGASTLLRTLSNKVILSSPTVNIPIGIPQFNASQDALFVYVNSTYKHQNTDWSINANLTSIDVMNDTWGSADNPTEVDFVVFKNMQSELVYQDGTMMQDNSISDAKLMPDNKVGSLVTLSTDDKSSAVNAINEVDNNLTTLNATFTEHLADDVNHVKYAVDTGTANAKVITLNPAPTSYVDGMAISFKNAVQNTGAVTININGLGAKSIKKANGNDLASGNLKAGIPYTLRYNGTNFILQGEGGEYGTADAPQVLEGYTVGRETGVIPGTMPNRGTFNLGLGATVPAGYYSGGNAPNGKRSASGFTVSSSSNQTFIRALDGSTVQMPSLTVTGLPFTPKSIIVYLTTDPNFPAPITMYTHIATATNQVTSNNIRLDGEYAYANATGFRVPVGNANTNLYWIAFD